MIHQHPVVTQTVKVRLTRLNVQAFSFHVTKGKVRYCTKMEIVSASNNRKAHERPMAAQGPFGVTVCVVKFGQGMRFYNHRPSQWICFLSVSARARTP